MNKKEFVATLGKVMANWPGSGRGSKPVKPQKDLSKIRARESYCTFAAVLKKIMSKGGHPSLLLDIHELMDDHQAFRSARASTYARESIGLVLRDYRAGKLDQYLDEFH